MEFFVEPSDSNSNAAIVDSLEDVYRDYIEGIKDKEGRRHKVYWVGAEKLATLLRERDAEKISFKIYVKDHDSLQRISEEEVVSFFNDSDNPESELTIPDDDEVVYLRVRRSVASLLMHLSTRYQLDLESGLFKTSFKDAKKAKGWFIKPPESCFSAYKDKKCRQKIIF